MRPSAYIESCSSQFFSLPRLSGSSSWSIHGCATLLGKLLLLPHSTGLVLQRCETVTDSPQPPMPGRHLGTSKHKFSLSKLPFPRTHLQFLVLIRGKVVVAQLAELFSSHLT